ncbi:MAG: hypothetical protein QNJ38_06415 [Prochloraceae cyanobacterium]|nr:hypothetical protein [Prochloraceae cyanobacterium]
MDKTLPQEGKSQIIAAFDKLIAEYTKGESKVATKEEEAEKEKNQELLETVSNYTVDNIVNGMASLQLDFGGIINELAEKLDTESSKLEELKKSIAIETENLKQLRKVRLVADRLYILRQEHQEQLKILQDNAERQQEAIEKEMSQTRKNWEREQQEFEDRAAETTEILVKTREKEVADYQYEIERVRKIEMDEYEEYKRQQERELQENNKEKEKIWVAREQYLAEHEAEFEANKKKIEGFEAKLKEEYQKAKDEAIKKATDEAKVKSNLFEKEWEAAQQGYELKIQSLQATITRQTEEIAELNRQLQEVTTQAQNLAMRAFPTGNQN